jgi:hypothetical protein
LRKRLLYGLLVVVALVALFLVVKSLGKKPAAPAGKRTASAGDSAKTGTRRARKVTGASDSLGRKAGAAAKRTGKLARSAGAKGKRGSLKGLTPEARAAEKKRLRAEKKRLKLELSRKRREERLASRAARRRGARKSGGRSLYDAYTLKGTVAGSYALVGSRRLEKGDVVGGKKIVDIGSDRIVVEQFGTRFTVRLGEPIDKGLTTGSRKR